MNNTGYYLVNTGGIKEVFITIPCCLPVFNHPSVV